MERTQEIHRVDHLRGVFTLDAQLESLMGAGSNEHGIVLGRQVSELNILADGRAGLDFDAKVSDVFDLVIEYVLGQPVVGNPDCKHTAGNGQRFEDRDLISFKGEVMSAREAGWA